MSLYFRHAIEVRLIFRTNRFYMCYKNVDFCKAQNRVDYLASNKINKIGLRENQPIKKVSSWNKA